MCGRYALHTNPMRVAQHLGLSLRLDWDPAYNIAPGREVPVIASNPDTGEPIGTEAHWGFHPHWAGEDAPTPINARAESLRKSRYFLDSFRHHRCLVPADGWYEWMEENDKKLPWYFARNDGHPIVFAGLMARGKDDSQTLAIITEPARGMAKTIHGRMPLVLTPESITAWLAPGMTDPDELREQVHHEPIEAFRTFRVSPAVNRPDTEGAELITPLSSSESSPSQHPT